MRRRALSLLCAFTGVLSPALAMTTQGVGVNAVAIEGATKLRTYIVAVHTRGEIDAVIERSRGLGARRFTPYRYALGGFSADFPARAVSVLRTDHRVRRITANVRVQRVTEDDLSDSASSGAIGVTESVLQVGAPYHLDRLDQRELPLDDIYQTPGTGEGVQIYMIDTGVNATHVEFDGRVIQGIDVIGPDESGRPSVTSGDCDGHGTHTAGLAAGKTFGVAKKAVIVAVRVLDCNGDGDIEGVIKGIDWVIRHHRNGTLAVANLSLGVTADANSLPLDDAVRDLIADGIVPVVAAGNKSVDACQISPGHLPDVLNVGAVDKNDVRFVYSEGGSNFGNCVDLFAPGVRLLSSGESSDTETHYESGTSMASPLVAGYVALLAQKFPTACPSSVIRAVVARATPNLIEDPGPESPNLLLNVSNLVDVSNTRPGTPSALVTSPVSRGIVISWDPGCAGGAITDAYDVKAYRVGTTEPVISRLYVELIDRVTVRGLDPTMKYFFRVRRRTNLGTSGWSLKSLGMIPRTISAGNKLPLANLAYSNEATINGKWLVADQSRFVCRVTPNLLRLFAMRQGKCYVTVRPRYTNIPFTRSLPIAEASTPKWSGTGRRLVYSQSGRRLYAIDALETVAKSIAVVAPVIAPPTGKFALKVRSVSPEGDNYGPIISVLKNGLPIIDVKPIPTVCDSLGACIELFGADALGTSAGLDGIYIPFEDASWFAMWAAKIRTFVVIR